MTATASVPAGRVLVSLDGGATFQSAEQGVRIVFRDLEVEGEERPGELHLNVTEEGVISDLWVTRDAPLDCNRATASETTEEIVDRMLIDA